MTPEMVGLGVFGLGLVLGLRGSVRLSRRLRNVWPGQAWQGRLLLGAFVITAWVVVAFALYVVVASIARLAGFGLPTFVGFVLAAAVLFIPVFLDIVVDRIAKSPVSRGTP